MRQQILITLVFASLALSVDAGADSKLSDVSKRMVGESSRSIAGTSNGRKACAAMVNRAVKRAYGTSICDSLSVTDMLHTLNRSTEWQRVSAPVDGAIVLSASKGRHVGVYSGGKVYSNSSSAREWRGQFSITSWRDVFGETYYFVRADSSSQKESNLHASNYQKRPASPQG